MSGEANEFLAIPKGDTVENDGDLDLSRWAKQMLTDPANREGVEAAFKAGKLSATMFGWLREQAQTVQVQDSKREGTKKMLDAASPFEFDVIINVSRRALGMEETPIRIPGAPAVTVPMAEIETTLREIYKP